MYRLVLSIIPPMRIPVSPLILDARIHIVLTGNLDLRPIAKRPAAPLHRYRIRDRTPFHHKLNRLPNVHIGGRRSRLVLTLWPLKFGHAQRPSGKVFIVIAMILARNVETIDGRTATVVDHRETDIGQKTGKCCCAVFSHLAIPDSCPDEDSSFWAFRRSTVKLERQMEFNFLKEEICVLMAIFEFGYSYYCDNK